MQIPDERFGNPFLSDRKAAYFNHLAPVSARVSDCSQADAKDHFRREVTVGPLFQEPNGPDYFFASYGVKINIGEGNEVGNMSGPNIYLFHKTINFAEGFVSYSFQNYYPPIKADGGFFHYILLGTRKKRKQD